MRDISQLQVRNSGKSIKSKAMWRFLVALVFVIVAIMIGWSKLNFGDFGGSSVVLREAARGLIPVNIEGDFTRVSDAGVDLITQAATFTDVKYGGEARATASRSYGGGIYILSVSANLPDPVNTNYQVWLVSGEKVLPIDYMRGSKNSWSLNLRSSDNYSSYDGIWITLERSKDDIPEEHVLEGSF